MRSHSPRSPLAQPGRWQHLRALQPHTHPGVRREPLLLPPLAPCPASSAGCSPGRRHGASPRFPCCPGHKPAWEGVAAQAGKGKLRQGGGARAPARSMRHRAPGRDTRVQGPPRQLVPPHFRCLGIPQLPENSAAMVSVLGTKFWGCSVLVNQSPCGCTCLLSPGSPLSPSAPPFSPSHPTEHPGTPLSPSVTSLSPRLPQHPAEHPTAPHSQPSSGSPGTHLSHLQAKKCSRAVNFPVPWAPPNLP